MAALAEGRRRDHKEYRQLWRDTQRRIDELTVKIVDTNETVRLLAEESREQDRRLGERIDTLAAESREQDRRLGERIDSLVSAIGDFIADQNPR